MRNGDHGDGVLFETRSVRKNDQKVALQTGVERHWNLCTFLDYPWQRRARQLWLYGFDRLDRKRRRQLRELLLAPELKTGLTWALKEQLRGLWQYRGPRPPERSSTAGASASKPAG